MFQIWAEGVGGYIKPQYMEAGVAVAAWHLTEAVRIFHEASKREEQRDAELLSQWLVSHAPSIRGDGGKPIVDERGCLSPRHILRYGPNSLRDKARRDRALIELASDEIAHIRETRDGRRQVIQINPWLLNASQMSQLSQQV